MGLVNAASAEQVDQSLRLQERDRVQVAGDPAQVSSSNLAFQRWISVFRNRAKAAGIGDQTFTRAFENVKYNTDVIAKDRNQNEFSKTIWEYLERAASDTRIENGRQALQEKRRLLRAIEAKYGVEKEIVTAIWGLESAYGTHRGSINVIEALATLAFDGRRGAFFEAQLIEALKILQSGDTAPETMTGSWAGAMGHTQFMPSSFQSFAVDFTGDGKRDIWSDDPSDALASTAAYLADHGWTRGQPWGIEVALPPGFDYALSSRKIRKLPSEWARLGVRDIHGRAVRNHGPASVLLPAGHKGAAFLIFNNFKVLESYNTADAYVIGVGHLADRLKGGPRIQSGWPYGDRALSFDERKEMQTLLTEKGFDTKGIDGLVGPLTIEAVRGFQRSIGDVPDGYASLNILTKLRR
ncbi:MAG: lytic murein transglycosylase [Thalassovita sp.]|nr:lytic murein transglycosylase [Thalassovita sp.]